MSAVVGRSAAGFCRAGCCEGGRGAFVASSPTFAAGICKKREDTGDIFIGRRKNYKRIGF